MQEIKRIIFIGNGMDISHGFKTSWWNIFDANDNSIIPKIFPFKYNKEGILKEWLTKSKNWNDFENEIKDLALAYKYFYSNFNFKNLKEINTIILILFEKN